MVAVPSLALPVFPGAVGFGTDTPAGRGGTIFRITNLSEAGTGSLGACVAAKGPRVCVFEVSGVIRLSQPMYISNPYITIAGQTAPSPGIMIAGNHLHIEASDVLIQHITFRRGDIVNAGPAVNLNNWSGMPVTNVVIDHCTLTWGSDETLTLWIAFGDITVSNSIVAEGLYRSPAEEYGGYGVILGPVPTARVAMIGNLLAHFPDRSPFSLVGQFAFVNNVVYDWTAVASHFGNQVNQQLGGNLVTTRNSLVGNLYFRGPSFGVIPNALGKPIWFDGSMAGSGNQVYLRDNAEITSATSAPVPPADPWSLAYVSSPNTRASLEAANAPTWPVGLTAMPVGQVKDHVLANAGSRPANRGARDAKQVSDVRNGVGALYHCLYPSSQYTNPAVAANVPNCDKRNAGGWPAYAVNTRALTLPANPGSDADGDGYTNLEEWLHQFAAEVEGRAPAAKPAPPSDVTAG